MSQILAGGKNSRLYKRLVYDLQIAQDVTAFQASAALGLAVPDHRHGAARRMRRRTPAGADRSHPDDRRRGDREAAADAAHRPASSSARINQIEASFYNRMESVGGFNGKGNQLNAYYTATGNPDYFNEDLSRYRALAAGDIQAAAAFWLPADRRVELTVEPVKDGPNPASTSSHAMKSSASHCRRRGARCLPARSCCRQRDLDALQQAPDRAHAPKPGAAAGAEAAGDPEADAVERPAGLDRGAAQGAGRARRRWSSGPDAAPTRAASSASPA